MCPLSFSFLDAFRCCLLHEVTYSGNISATTSGNALLDNRSIELQGPGTGFCELQSARTATTAVTCENTSNRIVEHGKNIHERMFGAQSHRPDSCFPFLFAQGAVRRRKVLVEGRWRLAAARRYYYPLRCVCFGGGGSTVGNTDASSRRRSTHAT